MKQKKVKVGRLKKVPEKKLKRAVKKVPILKGSGISLAVITAAQKVLKKKPVVSKAKPKSKAGRPRGRPRKVTGKQKQTTLETIPAVVKPIKRIRPLAPVKVFKPQPKPVPKPVPIQQLVPEAGLKQVEMTPPPVKVLQTGDKPIRINFPCKTCRFADRRRAHERSKNPVELCYCGKKKQFCAFCFDVRDFPNPKCDIYEKKEIQ